MSLLIDDSTRAPLRRFAAAVVLASAGLGSLIASDARAQSQSRDCLPPGNPYVGQFHAKYADGTNVYDLSNPRHSDFTHCDPPPGPGGSTTHTVGSFVSAQISLNGGPAQAFNANGNMTVRVNFNHLTGPTRFFDTEMLQLDLTGGGGQMIRESPTRQSTGKTAITDLGGGLFHIDSFFDVFTELSVDGGQTWHPSTDAAGNPYAGRMMIPGTVAVELAPWTNVKRLYQEP